MGRTLCPADIDVAVEEAIAFLTEKQVPEKEILRMRLGIEDALIRMGEHFGEDHAFELKCGKSLGKIRITVNVRGEMFDPFRFSGDSDTVDSFMRQALASVGDMPVWRYTLGTNSISFMLTKKAVPDLITLALAVLAAILVGFAMRSAPADISAFFEASILAPLLDTFMGFLGAIAGPMIFLAVAWGIYSIGDAATFSVLGKRLIARYIIVTTIVTVAFGMIILPMFTLTMGETTASAEGVFTPLFEMVLGVVPANLFTPFTEGNTLQILFVGIIVGLAMLFVGEKTQSVAIITEQISIILQIIMDVISKLVPLFVFGSLLDLIMGDDFDQIAQSYKLLFSNVGGCVFLILLYFVMVCARTGVSPMVYLKKALPTFIIGMTTASSSAAFATNRKTCAEQYGIEPRLSDFGVPFGQVIFKPSVSILFLSSAICTAEIFGVTVSTSWLISAFVMSIILSTATPPIPGGQLASYAVLFTQLNIPAEGIALVLAVGIVLDFLETPTDLFGGQSMLVLGANKFRMLNLDTLRNPKVQADEK